MLLLDLLFKFRKLAHMVVSARTLSRAKTDNLYGELSNWFICSTFIKSFLFWNKVFDLSTTCSVKNTHNTAILWSETLSWFTITSQLRKVNRWLNVLNSCGTILSVPSLTFSVLLFHDSPADQPCRASHGRQEEATLRKTYQWSDPQIPRVSYHTFILD